MNNDENKIEGIGEIQNQTANEVYRSNSSKQTIQFKKLFSDRNYSRYIYIGNTYYASKDELERNHTEDAQYINKQLDLLLHHPTPTPREPQLISFLERLLFKGARHMKRGSGITKIKVPSQQ